MHALLSVAGRLPTQNLASAATLGCHALAQLSDDVNFFRGYSRHARNRHDTSQEYDVITGVDHFEYFLDFELMLLTRAEVGMDQRLAKDLIGLVKKLRPEIRRGSASTDELKYFVSDLRSFTCESQSALARTGNVDGWRRRFLHAMVALAGAGMVALNTTAFAASLGLTAPGSAVSVSAGSAVMSPLVTDFLPS
jgi:hypothetical protein